MFEKAKEYVTKKKEEAKETIKKTAVWISENKEVTVAAILATYKLGNKALRYMNNRKLSEKRDRMYYDPRTYRWEEADRKLDKWEYDELRFRQQRGELVHNILRDMGRLK